MKEKIIQILGKSIQSQEIKSFLEEYQMKYPKKDVISNKADYRYYHIESSKLGIVMLFSIEILNSKYKVEAGEHKGTFIPILTNISFTKNIKTRLPFGLSSILNFNEVQELLGEPTLKSSDIKPTWLNADGSERFYQWIIPFDKEKDLYLNVRCRGGGDMSILPIILEIKEKDKLISFYDELLGQDIETTIKHKSDFDVKNELFFLKWALDNDFVILDKEMQVGAEKVKNEKIEVIDFLRDYFKSSNIYKEDFRKGQAFVKDYLLNLSGYDILYERDFAYTFLKNKKLRDNYLGEQAFIEMRKVDYTPENHKIVEAFISRRYNQYCEHGFSKSEKSII